jgi:hypothetical protein
LSLGAIKIKILEIAFYGSVKPVADDLRESFLLICKGLFIMGWQTYWLILQFG